MGDDIEAAWLRECERVNRRKEMAGQVLVTCAVAASLVVCGLVAWSCAALWTALVVP